MNTTHTEARPLLICRGQFFLVTDKECSLHLISDAATTQYYDRLAIAENCTRRDDAIAHANRVTFGLDAVLAVLPACSFDALMFYAENYVGLHSEALRGMAACILQGVPFGPDESVSDSDGGTHANYPLFQSDRSQETNSARSGKFCG